ncbi:MAG: polysaccharide biosynthesis tyrosine autokinase [Bacteroidetes bacterium]|nr:polysaccharide biosynthesis tyrosine autokinase [Bacteroidota bacterium]
MQVTQKRGIEDKGGGAIGEVIYKYLPYWPLFLILFVLTMAGAWAYLRLATPIYEVSAAIMVKDEKKGVDDANLMEQLDLFGSKKLVENEIEVIKSRMLMHHVVEELSLYAPVYAKAPFRDVLAYTSSPVNIQALKPDSVEEEKKVVFSFDDSTGEVVLRGKRFPLNQWIFDSVNTIRFVRNPRYVKPENKEDLFFTLVGARGITDNLLNGLKVTQATKLSSVIDLKIRDAVQQRGEDVLNGLIAAYNSAAIADKNALAANTLKFINQRLKLVAGELDSVELNIQRYKTREGIVDISAQGQLYLDNVGANDQKLSEVNVQLAVLDQVEKYILSNSDQPGIVPSALGADNAALAALLSKLYDLEATYQGLQKTTAENNPMLLSIRNEIDKLKPNILESVRSQRRNLEAGKVNLTGTSNQYAAVLQKLPQKERGLVEISRQQTIKNGIYSFLLQKREETALSYNSAVADTRLVDNAQATDKPVSPRRILIYLIAVVIAFGAGAGFVALREVLNREIVFRSEIEEATGIPVIGEIMMGEKDTPFVVTEGGRSVIAEQFRQLRTSLAYIGVNGRKKKVLITSTIAGEGKSFVSSNLSLTLALANKKVVLLEMDLRRPALSPLFGASRQVGLTNYFVGDKEADHIIKSTTIHPNLFFIPAGAIPPNPSELIMNGRLEELLKYLENIFDFVIIDTAPTNPVTDAYLLSPMCDATLYVVRHGVTPKSAIRTLDANIVMRPLKNVAIVFNGIRNRGFGRIGYGYGYGQEGTHNYFETEKDRKKREKKATKA